MPSVPDVAPERPHESADLVEAGCTTILSISAAEISFDLDPE